MSIIGDGCVVSRGECASIFATGLAQNGNTVYAEKNGKRRNGKWTTIVSPNPAAHGLPDEYTELSYIQSTGTQYIDTLLSPSSTLGFDIYATILSAVTTSSGYGALYGASVGSNWYKATTYAVNSGGYIDFGSWSSSRYNPKFTQNATGYLKYNGNGTLTCFDGTTQSVNYTLESTSAHIALFAGSQYGSEKISAKMYYAKWTNSGNTVRYFIPCRRNSDSSIGMYDLITQAFFENKGSGSFTAGTEIPTYLYTSGFLCEGIDEYGTWTVTATNGSKTTTKNVVIDAAEQFDILLKYSNNYGPLTATDFNSGTFAGDSGYFSYSLLTNQQDGSAGFTLTGKSNNNGRTKTPHWTSNITPNQHNSISFYAKKNANHGAAWIDVWQNGSYTQLWYVHYNNLPTSYTKYTVNISNVADGELRFSGGWFDSTGNNSSSVSYCKIIFDE